ncbi:NCS2 family permease, partial [Candidatus Sumerlaeota bacterium]|nr:NCS2 family permease [Candidatus Sumerlaeota bacterium]
MSNSWGNLVGFDKSQTTVGREVLAGITTFMTMAYIVAVNPGILGDPRLPSNAQIPFDGVIAATCLGSALACIMMGIVGRYPFALAPGMGINAYFAYVVAAKYGYQVALGAVFLAGATFLILTFVRIRQLIIDAVPSVLKHSVAAGIGLFIAFIGFQNAGLVVKSDATMVTSFGILTPQVLTAAFGLALVLALFALRVRGAILIGIVAATVFSFFADAIAKEIAKEMALLTDPHGMAAELAAIWTGIWHGIAQVFASAAQIRPTDLIAMPKFSALGQLDIRGALGVGLLEVVFAFLF